MKFIAKSRKYRKIFKVKCRKKTREFGITGLSTWGISKSQKGTEPGVQKGKRSLLSCHTCCECSMKTSRNSVKVTLGIQAMKLVKSLIGWEVTVTGRESECHLSYPVYKWAIFMSGMVLKTIYFLKGNNADNSNLILLGLEKQRGITHEA